MFILPKFVCIPFGDSVKSQIHASRWWTRTHNRSEMEEEVPHLIKKLSLSSCNTEFCDFTLDEQNALSEAKGVTVTTKANTPLVGKTVNYIVAFILVNDADEVLMMQESRESCRGKWYLPAGRMEAGKMRE